MPSALLALAALAPLAAQAQTPVTLVSNIGQTGFGNVHARFAQPFNTGKVRGGYELKSVKIPGRRKEQKRSLVGTVPILDTG